MSATSSWTDDRIELLTCLWREGSSASQIARRLGGVTRNAVIGKIHRLGLSGRATPSRPGARRAKPKVERRLRVVRCTQPMAAAPPRPEPLEPLPQIGLASVLTVRRGQCRWPMGEPREASFCLCGRQAVRGAYCAPHGAVAYRDTPRDHLLRLAGLR